MKRDQVDYAAYLVGRMISREDGVVMLCEKYAIEERDARRLWRAGKRSLKRWIARPDAEHHLESAAFYRAVVQDLSLIHI